VSLASVIERLGGHRPKSFFAPVPSIILIIEDVPDVLFAEQIMEWEEDRNNIAIMESEDEQD